MNSITGHRDEDIILKLTQIFMDDENIQFAFLFGSYAGRHHKRRSDLDIAIFVENPPEGLDLLYYINKLSDLSGREVDLVVLNTASAFLRHQVMKFGIPLVIKTRVLYRKFRERTISDYSEYKFVSGLDDYDR
jgi:uncharacterized protein